MSGYGQARECGEVPRNGQRVQLWSSELLPLYDAFYSPFSILYSLFSLCYNEARNNGIVTFYVCPISIPNRPIQIHK